MVRTGRPASSASSFAVAVGWRRYHSATTSLVDRRGVAGGGGPPSGRLAGCAGGGLAGRPGRRSLVGLGWSGCRGGVVRHFIADREWRNCHERSRVPPRVIDHHVGGVIGGAIGGVLVVVGGGPVRRFVVVASEAQVRQWR